MTQSPDRARHAFPAYSVGEQRADIAAHVVGVASGLVGTLVLLVKVGTGSPLLMAGAGLYAVGLVSMLSFSAAYHFCSPSPAKEWLRRLDHAAIFVMIAGTITPFLMNRVGGGWGFGLLAVVWTVAVFGVALKLVHPRRWERLMIVLYVGLGLSILIVAGRLVEAVPAGSLMLLAAGAAIYLVGVVFHLWERLPYQNAIWHFLVLAAAAVHYLAIFDVVALAADAPCAVASTACGQGSPVSPESANSGSP